jgi:hypothetical protein
MKLSMKTFSVAIVLAMLPIVAMAQSQPFDSHSSLRTSLTSQPASMSASRPVSQPTSMPTSRPASQPAMTGASYPAEWVASFKKAEQLRDDDLAHINGLIAVEVKDLKATIALAEVENKFADYTQRRANSHGGSVATDKFIAEYNGLQQQKSQATAQLSEVTAADIKKSSPTAVIVQLKKILADLRKQQADLKAAFPPPMPPDVSGVDKATWDAAYKAWKKAETLKTLASRPSIGR